MKNSYPFNIGILLVVLLSVCGGTVAAAQLAVPGESLYKIKTLSEDARLALAIPEKTKMAVHFQITEEKIREVKKLQQREAKAEDIEVALEEINDHSERLSDYVKNNKGPRYEKVKQDILKQQNKLEELKNKDL